MSGPWQSGEPPVIRFAYHRPGQGTTTYKERLLADRREVKVLDVSCYEGPPVRIEHRMVLEPGARALWFVIPDAWFDVGRFHLTDGTPTGWYTNFCTPVVFDDSTWRATDLFLDHWLSDEGWECWLDERELSHARAAGLLTPAMVRGLEDGRTEVARRLAARDWPPHFIRGWPEGQDRTGQQGFREGVTSRRRLGS